MRLSWVVGTTVAVLTGVGTAWARQEPRPPVAVSARTLHLRAAAVDTAQEPNMLGALRTAADDSRRHVLQLDGPLTPQRRALLEAASVSLGDYLPMHAYVVRLDGVDRAALSTLRFVHWVGVYRDDWKLDPRIGVQAVAKSVARQRAAQGRVKLVVAAFTETSAEVAAVALQAAGAEVVAVANTSRNLLIDVEMPMAGVAGLASLDWVQFIEPAPEGTFRNNTNEWILQSNVPNSTPVWDHGIHGERQVGGLIDGPLWEGHCSFDDDIPPGPDHRKIIAYRGAMGSDSHGTHTAGTFVGDQGTWGDPDFRDGLAFAAKLSFSSVWDIYAIPSMLYARLSDAHSDGARVHSNSWGDDSTTDYTTWSRQIDDFSRSHEDSLVLFAVTNMPTLKTPENAKNVLAVGATQDTPNQRMHYSGGTGPTSDGRRKPEVYAPGAGTMSSSIACYCCWASQSGTSMACPAVSGAGLLVRQYFTDGFHPTGTAFPGNARTPTGALIKAVLINSAVDMTGVTLPPNVAYPNDKEGWGRIRLDGPLHFVDDASILFVEDLRNTDGLVTEERIQFQIQVLESSVPLRVTLVWTDVPATVGTSFAPVNDLDLQVQGPDASLYLGNVFDTWAGASIPGGSRDDRNNVEQVHLLTPAPGPYGIEVVATAINVERQGFALVVTGAIASAMVDCNENGINDACDVDCGPSGGACDVGGCGGSEDCSGNGIPDECEPDFDGDGLVDSCDPDIDNDGVLNEVDACDHSPTGAPVRSDGSPYGDYDLDCDVALSDYQNFDNCLGRSGPGLPGQQNCSDLFDADGDLDTDLADFAVFQLGFTGP